MTRLRRKRSILALSSLGIVGAVAALAIGGTMALFGSTASPSTSTFTTGTVVLTGTTTNATNYAQGDAPTNLGTCTFTNMAAGGTTGPTINGAPVDVPYICDYQLTLGGTLPAWVSLNVSTSSAAGSIEQPPGSQTPYGGEALLDGSATGLQVAVFSEATASSASQVFTIGTVAPPSGLCPADPNTANSLTYCTSTSSAADGQAIGNSPWNPGQTTTIQVEGMLPLDAGNEYESGTASVTVSATAVQSDNNSGNDCYQSACSTYGPIAQSVAVSATNSTVILTYDQPVVFGFSDYGQTPVYSVSNPSGFLVQDVTEPLASGSYDSCKVTNGATSVGSDLVTLTLGSCTGSPPKAGDLFDVTVFNGGGNFITGTTSNGSSNGSLTYPYAMTPQAFWNQVAS